MTEQKFYDYIYDSIEDGERVASVIEKMLWDGWLVKHYQVYDRNHFTRMSVLFEKNNCPNPEIK